MNKKNIDLEKWGTRHFTKIDFARLIFIIFLQIIKLSRHLCFFQE